MSAPDEPFDIPSFLATLTSMPGVYRMLDEKQEVIYVGKARNLKKRVSSYFRRGDSADAKTRALVSQIRRIEITVTHTEKEALILENTLIKKYRPRYNVLLRDDKSYPYIYLSSGTYPRIAYHRGKQRAAGRYFGPYPNAVAVHETLNLLQKIFRVRQCEENFFCNRTRPCLQFQIGRCSGPCVGIISEKEYEEAVRHTVMTLEGKSNRVVEELAGKMEEAAKRLDFEQAAYYRDQVASLRRVQERQYVSGEEGNLDVVAGLVDEGVGCVEVFVIRQGQNLGNKSFLLKNTGLSEPPELIEAFLSQYYIASGTSKGRVIPREILVNLPLEEADLLERVLSDEAGHRVTITSKVRGERARWLEMAVTNARQALSAHLATRSTLHDRFVALQQALGLAQLPGRIECFDISHTMGEAAVASCVVFDQNGPLKSDYRRFNIEQATGGDDYGAMREALTRRFRRMVAEEGKRPDLLLIDGGKGQVAEAQKVMSDLGIGDILVMGVAKGASRKAGLEQLVLSDPLPPFILPPDSPALHLIQQVRDEAHRFAITGHRARRHKSRITSRLEGIPGLGPKRRQQLLRQFGGLQEVARAGVEDLARVPGISKALAQRLYDALHGNEGSG